MEQDQNQEAYAPKQRHGCVSAWLILMIVVNAISAVANLFAGDYISQNLPEPIPPTMLVIMSLIGLCNVIFAVMLMQWKKWAFWGFALTSVITMGINLSLGFGIAQSLLGLGGVVILYAILQIKENQKSAWENLE
jgi:hypothetical protein